MLIEFGENWVEVLVDAFFFFIYFYWRLSKFAQVA